MCGIAGYSLAAVDLELGVDRARLNRALAIAIEHRGRDATGLVFYRDGVKTPQVVKRPTSATKFFADMPDVGKGATHALIHTRNATNGHPSNSKNNHPHNWGTVHLIHNGIISNYEPVFDALNHKPYSECDSEAAAVAVAEKGATHGMEMIAGWAAVAWFDEEEPDITWGANLDGEMYLLLTANGSLVFGSEKATVLDPDVILAGIDGFKDEATLYHVTSGKGWRHDRTTGQITWWDFDDEAGRKNYPKQYPAYTGRGFGGTNGYGVGWDDEWDDVTMKRLRAITSGESQSDFAADAPFDKDGHVHNFNEGEQSLPFDQDILDAPLEGGDAVVAFDADHAKETLVVRKGDTISIGGFACVVDDILSEDEITVRWLDEYVDLREHAVTLLERATDKEEVTT